MSIGENDRLVSATYESGKLSGVEILSGTKIGDYVIKAQYSTEDAKTTKLYFWNISTLKANAASATVGE